MSDKVSQAIVDAAERLGFEAVRVWPQIVMLTWTTAVFWLILEPIMIGLSIYATVRVVRWIDRATTDEEDRTSVFIGRGLAIAVCALVCFILLLAMGNDLATVLYPEARAVLKLAGK